MQLFLGRAIVWLKRWLDQRAANRWALDFLIREVRKMPVSGVKGFMSSTYGRLNAKQEAALALHVQGALVHDLGAGDLSLAADLLRMGAKQVIAIDKDSYRKKAPQGIIPVTCHFEDYPSPVDVAFVSWPREKFDLGLLNICRRARIVIYLGSNTRGNACGFPRMWQHLATRQVLAYVPEDYNSLVIYSSALDSRRYLPEEYAAIFQDKIWSFQDIHAIADTLPLVDDVPDLYGN